VLTGRFRFADDPGLRGGQHSTRGQEAQLLQRAHTRPGQWRLSGQDHGRALRQGAERVAETIIVPSVTHPPTYLCYRQVDGTCKGAGGSMHIYDKELNFQVRVSCSSSVPGPQTVCVCRAAGRWCRSSCPTLRGRPDPSCWTGGPLPANLGWKDGRMDGWVV
jgi:hypothetical protein